MYISFWAERTAREHPLQFTMGKDFELWEKCCAWLIAFQMWLSHVYLSVIPAVLRFVGCVRVRASGCPHGYWHVERPKRMPHFRSKCEWQRRMYSTIDSHFFFNCTIGRHRRKFIDHILVGVRAKSTTTTSTKMMWKETVAKIMRIYIYIYLGQDWGDQIDHCIPS